MAEYAQPARRPVEGPPKLARLTAPSSPRRSAALAQRYEDSYVLSNSLYSNFWLILANFERLVLGCIEAEFCKYIVNTRLKALDEIYKIQ